MYNLRKIGFEMFWKQIGKNISMTLNGNDINLPSSVIIPFRDKFRVRKLLRKQPLLLHVMLQTEKPGLL